MESSQHDMDRTETVLVRLPGPFDRDSDTPVPHEGGVHLLDDINAERSSSNPSPPVSDHSPTPRGITAPLGDAISPSLEEALSNLAIGDNIASAKEAASDADVGTPSAHGNANHSAVPLTLLEIIHELRSLGYPIPPGVEAMTQDADAFDSNGERIVTPIDPKRVDKVKMLLILEHMELLQDAMSRLTEILDAPALAELESTCPILTPEEALIRFRRGGVAELFRTREGWDFVLLMIGLDCLQAGYKLWRLYRAIERAT